MSQQVPTGLRGPRFRLAADIAFTLAASSGLGWWTIWFAVARHSWEGWATGGGALLMIALGLLLSVPIIGEDLNLPAVLAVIATVISEFGLGWLTVSFATDHYAWPTWLFISLAYVVLLLAFGSLPSITPYVRSVLGRVLGVAFTVAPAATTGGVAGRLAVRGHPDLAWIPGGLAIGYMAILGIYAIFYIFDEWSLPQVVRPFAEVGRPPGATASLAAQLVGIVLPAGAVVWAVERATHRVTMVSMATDVAVTSIAVAVLLAAQSLILSSVLRVALPLSVHEALAEVIWAEADQYQVLVRNFGNPSASAPSPLRPDTSSRVFLEMYTQRRSFPRGPSDERARFAEHIAQVHTFKSRAGTAEQNAMIDRWDDTWNYAEEDMARRNSRRSRRPLTPASAVSVAVATLVATGIVIDAAWPRIELILPPGLRREIRRAEGYVALLRVLGAGALCAAITWPVVAGLAGAAPGLIALLVIAPQLIAAAVVWHARRRMTSAYQRRADAISVYRTELVRAMRLQLPRDSHGLRSLGRILSNSELADDPSLTLVAPGAEQPGVADLTGLRQSLAEDVSQRVLGDVSNLIGAWDEHLTRRLATVGLTAENLSDLSAQVSATVSGSVDQKLGRQIQDATTKAYLNLRDVLLRQQQDLQQELRRDLEAQVREVVRASVEESVSGPPLANFVGYVAIELDRRNGASDSIRGGKGRLIAPAGKPVNLIMTVVRDPRALAVPPTVSSQADKPFYVFEPFDIQGGRDEPVADFHALVESPTLTPLPHRKDLRVEKEAQAAFTVKLPDEAGTHEVWFQLYQAGRLVQVTAVRVEAQAEESSTVTG